jgi:hypothetical protein
MPKKSGSDATIRQLERARELLDQGRQREALALALEAVLQELYCLRSALRELADANLKAPKDPPAFALHQEPGRPRSLH